MFADLHLHSHYSDGTFTPEEIVTRGRKQGLGALSLTSSLVVGNQAGSEGGGVGGGGGGCGRDVGSGSGYGRYSPPPFPV